MITGKTVETGLLGLDASLSAYDSQDGALQVCHNLLNDGAGLRPVKAPEALEEVKVGHELLYIHHTANGDVYITSKSGEMYWTKGGVATSLKEDWLEGGQITSVGNILCMSDGSEIKYFLWKGDAEGYAYLGDKLPELKMEFALFPSNYQETEYETISVLGYADIDIPTYADGYDDSKNTTYAFTDKKTDNIDEDDQEVLDTFDTVFGSVNKMIALAKSENRFAFPFFVRYAYEMYDGSLMMHSTPILMLPSTTVNPLIACLSSNAKNWISADSTYNGRDMKRRYSTWICHLNASLLGVRITEKPDLGQWKDLITGVKIFVTQQIYPYDPDGSYLRIGNKYEVNQSYYMGYVSSSLYTKVANDTYFAPSPQQNFTYNEDGLTQILSNQVYGIGWLYLPPLTDTTIEEKIKSANLFYLFKEYGIEEFEELYNSEAFQNGFHLLGLDENGDVEKDLLTNIETREQMTDDYHTHDIITAKVLSTYNSRLNKADCQLIPFTEMPGEWLSCYTSQAGEEDTSTYTFSADIYLKENGVKIKVDSTKVVRGLMSGYFFYPNPSAYLMIVKRTDSNGVTQYARLTLKKHDYLFGAYYFSGFEEIEWSDSVTEESVTEGATSFSYPNYIYTSEVDNPFTFPSTGVNAVGNGRIVTLKTATKAMSQGTSFGTNPLYAFCTDGIWALEVGDTGIYTAKQPVSMERLLNDDALSATQIDNSILFLSERGMMELVGGETRLLSGVLKEMHSAFDVEALPYWTTIHKKFGGQDYLEADDFKKYIGGARIAFDYSDYKVVVFRKGAAVAYIYDMVNKTWGTVENNLISVVEDSGLTLVNYKDSAGIHAGAFTRESNTLMGDGMGFYTTRPLKYGASDTLKTIRTLVERSLTQTPHYMALWGSRDMERWVLIGAVEGGRMPRLSGTPYKYFIVGGWAQLSINGGAISRLTTEVVTKWMDKVR